MALKFYCGARCEHGDHKELILRAEFRFAPIIVSIETTEIAYTESRFLAIERYSIDF